MLPLGVRIFRWFISYFLLVCHRFSGYILLPYYHTSTGTVLVRICEYPATLHLRNHCFSSRRRCCLLWGLSFSVSSVSSTTTRRRRKQKIKWISTCHRENTRRSWKKWDTRRPHRVQRVVVMHHRLPRPPKQRRTSYWRNSRCVSTKNGNGLRPIWPSKLWSWDDTWYNPCAFSRGPHRLVWSCTERLPSFEPFAAEKNIAVRHRRRPKPTTKTMLEVLVALASLTKFKKPTNDFFRGNSRIRFAS